MRSFLITIISVVISQQCFANNSALLECRKKLSYANDVGSVIFHTTKGPVLFNAVDADYQSFYLISADKINSCKLPPLEKRYRSADFKSEFAFIKISIEGLPYYLEFETKTNALTVEVKPIDILNDRTALEANLPSTANRAESAMAYLSLVLKKATSKDAGYVTPICTPLEVAAAKKVLREEIIKRMQGSLSRSLGDDVLTARIRNTKVQNTGTYIAYYETLRKCQDIDDEEISRFISREKERVAAAYPNVTADQVPKPSRIGK